MEKITLLTFFETLLSSIKHCLCTKNNFFGLDFSNLENRFSFNSREKLGKIKHRDLGFIESPIEILTFYNRISSRFFSFMIVLLLAVIIPFSALGQTCPTNSPGQQDLRANYDTIKCPAQDVRVDKIFLTNADPCNSCKIGTELMVNMKITLTNNSNSTRYPSIQGDLTITPLGGGNSTQCLILTCSQLLGSETKTFDLGQIKYVCGSRLVLNNVLIIWETPSGNCPVNTPPNGKYCFAPPIVVTPPFSAVLNPTCGVGNTENIDLVVSGGSGSFTYLWDTGQTTQDLTNVPIGAHSVTVTDTVLKDTDGISCKITESNTFAGPCCVAPEITLQPSNQIKCVGQNASFSVSFTGGNPAPTIQWQVSTNGGANWGNLANETNATLTLNGSLSQ
ncbi:hypothetical protein [uncultured Flavobacterium sp.]|uniref:hypothetical protein n=1 Tax=uncultured Flavobacterium sp. TaxID=165435 RepID=UPI00292CE0EC|nr:hypothetical protein [uncultured Flavobacterium sp.]